MTGLLNEKIIELETKIAFQEYTIEQLNSELLNQQNDIEKLKTAIKVLQGKLNSCVISNVALPSEETPPPHY